jgi:predicted xylose isomerase-like sugar epimerase
VPIVLEEEVRVEGDDAGLVGLGDVGEDAVDHADEHAVLVRVARVLDDRDDVRALRSVRGAVGEGSGR